MVRPDHPEAAALYRAILADPDEDTPRLAYADWLDEHGDTPPRPAGRAGSAGAGWGAERAEFIRLQCRLARCEEWDDGYVADSLRAERLLGERGEEWLGLADGARRFEYSSRPFHRGFVARARVSAGLTADAARRLFAHFPVTEAEFRFDDSADRQAQFDRLAFDAYPNLRSVILDRDFRYGPDELALNAAVCRALASAECRSALTRLSVDGDPTPEGLAALVTSPYLRRLEFLSVRGDRVGDDHARVLAERLNSPSLRELVLGHHALTPAGGEALGKATWLPQLRALRLYGHTALGDAGVGALFGSQPLPDLRTMHVHHCEQQGADLRLAGSAGLPGLIEVISAGSYPDGNDLLALVSGPQSFRSIDVPGSFLNPTQAGKFFAAPAVRDLRRLVLRSARLSPAAVGALSASPLANTLRSLDLSTEHGTDPVPALLAGPAWPHLERLSLQTLVPAESLLALVNSGKFPRFVSLAAGCADRARAFLKGLAKSPSAAKFRELDLNVALTPAAARELADSPHLGGLDRLLAHKGRTDAASCEQLVKRFGKRVQIRKFNA